MTQTDMPAQHGARSRGAVKKSGALTRLVASRRFQKWAARFPLTRRKVRREGEAMFDLVAGFCHSQILLALVRFGIPDMLVSQEMTLDALAEACDVPLERMYILLSGATSLGLLKQRRSGHYALTTRGAALAGVPGLQGMIDHHDILYLDLADPVAFFRGQVETELAEFWPYVFGAGSAENPQRAATYSRLMADSQQLVADDTLAAFDFANAHRVMDVGGGTGTFLTVLGDAYPDLVLTLFDLPAVIPGAEGNFAAAGLRNRTEVIPGSFRDEELPGGADLITLVRVLYDHEDETVAKLLASVFKALPPGGRLVVSEPMTGGGAPQRAGDAYFALYCLAMRTGRARSSVQIGALMKDAGFVDVTTPRARRPFITSVITCVKPD